MLKILCCMKDIVFHVVLFTRLSAAFKENPLRFWKYIIKDNLKLLFLV